MFEKLIGYAVRSWGFIICEGLDTFLEGATVQDGIVEPLPLPLGIILSPSDGSFKEEVVLALSIHPGVVAPGLGFRWKVCPSLNTGGSHAVSVKLFHNTSYFAWVCFYFACVGGCEYLGLRRSSVFAIEDFLLGKSRMFSNFLLLTPTCPDVALGAVVSVYLVNLLLEIFVMVLEDSLQCWLGGYCAV